MERPLADPPDTGWDPMPYGEPPRGDRLYAVLRGLVATFVGLNLVVVAMLVAVTLINGGDDADEQSAVATESTESTESRDADTAAPDPGSNETTDEEATTGDGAVVDPVDPAGDVPLVATSPLYPDPFEPTINEVQPEAKRIGAFATYLITNYEAGASLNDVVATLPSGASQVPGLVAEVDLVHHEGMWSRGTVEYVQLGGHRNGRISNIIVIRQDLGFEGSTQPERTETRVMEVRLARDEAGDWAFETIASAGGAPAERPTDLSATASAVVDHDRIELPDTAVWDIYRGYINQQVFEVMLDIADRTPYSVVVLQTGHSYNVFGTDRVSNHSVGRAFDIYKLDTELVIDSHATWSGFYELSEWIVSRYDIREFGSPWLFPDAVAHTFTDEVHADHLHIGVHPYPTSPDPPPPPAEPPAE